MEKNKRKNPGKKYRTSAILSIVFGIWFVFLGISFLGVDSSAPMIYFILGLILLILGIYRAIIAQKVYSIDNMIICGVTSLDEISMSSHLSYDKVTRIINKLIQKNIYTDMYINTMTRSIEKRTNNGTSTPVQQVSCPNCHAPTSDKNGVCEFCGASLK